MYKDPDKQREANKQANKRYRDKQGITETTVEGITAKGITQGIPVIPKQSGTKGKDKGITITTKGVTSDKPTSDKAKVTPEQAKLLEGIFGKEAVEEVVSDAPKRGKDIKVFADLPPHVQETIEMMAKVDGKIDKTIKANRTAIAINYQHLFPGRFHSVGVI